MKMKNQIKQSARREVRKVAGAWRSCEVRIVDGASIELGSDRRELERNIDEFVGHGMLDEEELQVFVSALIGAGLVEWIGGAYRCDEDLDFAATWSDWYHE